MCRVIKDYGAVAEHGSKALKLQTIYGPNKEKVLALVSYKDGMSVNTYEFTNEEAKTLRELLAGYIGYEIEVVEQTEPEQTVEVIVEEEEEKPTSPFNDTVRTLTSLPANDVNFQTTLRKATTEDLEIAIHIMKTSKTGKHGTRIKFCEGRLNSLAKKKQIKEEEEKHATSTTVSNIEPLPFGGSATEIEAEEEKEEKPITPTKEAKILTFPTAEDKPAFIQLITEGNHTYEEVLEKMGKEREEFKDVDSQYVIDGLCELAKVDQNFRNNIMREDKSYGEFMVYMFEAARKGYCVKYGNVGWIDRDTGLGLAIEYYNNDTEKVEEEAKAKREAEAEKAAAERKEAKKNGKNIRKNKKRADA